MKNLSHVLAYVQDQPWALHPRVMAQMVELLRFRASGGELTTEEIQARIEIHAGDVEALHAQQRNAAATGADRGIAVIPVFGVIAQHAHMVNNISGPRGTSTEAVGEQLRAALANPNVDAIVLNFHTPGGSVYGVGELATEIRSARKQKPVTAVANSEMLSAGYYLGSNATDVSVTPNGRVGSIGVWSGHEDLSKALELEGVKITLMSAGKYKVAGNPFEPLSEEARDIMQSDVDTYYDLFVNAVARGRGVSVNEVRSGFGEGRSVLAKEALDAKMVDRVETLEQAIDRIARELNARSRAPRADELADEPKLGTTSTTELSGAHVGFTIALDEKSEDESTETSAEEVQEDEGVPLNDEEEEAAARLRLAELS